MNITVSLQSMWKIIQKLQLNEMSQYDICSHKSICNHIFRRLDWTLNFKIWFGFCLSFINSCSCIHFSTMSTCTLYLKLIFLETLAAEHTSTDIGKRSDSNVFFFVRWKDVKSEINIKIVTKEKQPWRPYI